MNAIQLQHRPDGVALLTFDQPASRANILTRALWDELHATILELGRTPDVRGLVLASAKPGIFIAGADLKFFAGITATQDPAVQELIEWGLATLALLESLPFPTCAAIDGAALGGGLEVAMACDVRLAGTHAKVELGLPEVKLGLIPGWGGTQRLPRIVGLDRAAEMLANGQSLTAEQARDAGLVSAIVQSESLLDFAARHVVLEGWREMRDTKQKPIPQHARDRFQAPVPSAPPAVREAMQLLNRGPSLPLPEACQLETAAFLNLAGSQQSRQLIAEFFAKRRGA